MHLGGFQESLLKTTNLPLSVWRNQFAFLRVSNRGHFSSIRSRFFRSIFNNGPWLILQEEQKTVLAKFDIPYLKATNIVDVDGFAVHFKLPTCLVRAAPPRSRRFCPEPQFVVKVVFKVHS